MNRPAESASEPAEEAKGPFPSTISKEEINALHLRRYEGPVEIVRDDAACSAAIRKLKKEKVLGFDTETRPSFKKGQSYQPSLVQLGASDCVYIFQLRKLTKRRNLFRLLANNKLLKAGVATQFDVRQLQEIEAFEPAGFVNLETLTDELGIKNNGLRSLTALVLGFRVSKGEQRSNWSRVNLTPAQVRYAATDAWVSREIYLRLEEAIHARPGGGKNGSKPESS